ncbi:hypothetical protein CIG75_00700 [Tumebacillus algifaecis]|uniref:Uncharacterized protein n=1 Tax=Tumebacillus algifaecis TaxID=1214604 RepID=A0A223D670_9BACL|nr:hypothetical protein CIG75_00700 [Tumebacillus algifaecis]
MPVSEVVSAWTETKSVFIRYGVPIDAGSTLSEVVPEDVLPVLLRDLNQAIGSSAVTCIEGG